MKRHKFASCLKWWADKPSFNNQKQIYKNREVKCLICNYFVGLIPAILGLMCHQVEFCKAEVQIENTEHVLSP